MFNNITIICIGRAVFTNLDTVLIRPSLTLEQTRTKPRCHIIFWVWEQFTLNESKDNKR